MLIGNSYKQYLIAEKYHDKIFWQLKELIYAQESRRIKRCPECQRFFFDFTKNRSKIYCSSRTCGNRLKQRAFYQRKRT